jgi:23S rRNA pseudouridine1911/1915/1917 synthase
MHDRQVDYSQGACVSADQLLPAAPVHACDPEPLRFDAFAGVGQRLDRFLASVLVDVSRTRIQRWIALAAVTVDGQAVLPRYRLRGIETIRIWPMPSEAERSFEPDDIALSIIHEDADLMVIDKPVGLVAHPAPGHWRGTLMNALLHARPDSARLPRAGIIHRLDKDTSGLLMVARSERAFERLSAAIAARTVGRRYFAVAQGVPPERLTIEAPIGRDPRDRLRMAVVSAERGKAATTHVERLSVGDRVAAIECRLETGRTHQIRVHLASRGHPLIGDRVYGGSPRGDFDRQALHAWCLELDHPVSGDRLRMHSLLPVDILSLLDALQLPVPVMQPPPSSGSRFSKPAARPKRGKQ